MEGIAWRPREQVGCKTREWLAGLENCNAEAAPSSNPGKPVAIEGYERTAFIDAAGILTILCQDGGVTTNCCGPMTVAVNVTVKWLSFSL